MNRQVELQALIERAFAQASYPGDAHLFPSDVEEALRRRNPLSDTYASLLGSRWQDLTSDNLADINIDLLSPVGAAYFCPAVLLAYLEIGPRGSLPDFISKFIGGDLGRPSTPAYWPAAAHNFLMCLGGEQIRAINAFLHFIAAPDDSRVPDDEAKIALDLKWDRAHDSASNP